MANPNFWYPRYFKDYAAKTAHLSLAEHGAYALLLDYYYQGGGKLMANAMAIVRVCRCQTDEERSAVQSVLEQFFRIDEHGMYRNDRADREMGIAANISLARSVAGKAGAQARWNKAQGMPIGMRGPLANAKQSAWQNDAQPQPQPQPEHGSMSGRPDAMTVLNYLNEQAGRNYKPVKANLSLITARLAEGATVLECCRVIDDRVKAWKEDLKMAEYLRPATLFNATKFAQYVGDLGAHDQGLRRDWE